MQETKGWIKLHRTLTEHWLWEDKPFAKGQAWVDLISMANCSPRKLAYKNDIVLIERGEFSTSELKLMERWGWGKTKLRSFLRTLEKDGMIIKKANKKRTVISIVNYDAFQTRQTTDKPQADREKTASKLQANTNKNSKNIKNSISSAAALPPQLNEILLFISEEKLNVNGERFFIHYTENGWRTEEGKPIKDWRRLLRVWDSKEMRDRPVYQNGYAGVKNLADD